MPTDVAVNPGRPCRRDPSARDSVGGAELLRRFGPAPQAHEIRLEDIDRGSHQLGPGKAPGSPRGESRQDGHDPADAIGDSARNRDSFDDRIEKVGHRANLVALAGAGFVERLFEQQRPEHDVVERAPARSRHRVDRAHLAEEPRRAALGRLFVVEERGQLRQDHGHGPDFPEKPHRPVGGAAAEEAQNLFEDAGARGFGEVVARAHHRVVDVGCDAQIEAGRELDCAQDSNRVLAEPDRRIADGVDRVPAKVRKAAAPVQHLVAIEVVKERVDREIAADRVFMRVAEDVVAPYEQIVERLAVLLFGRFHHRVTAEGSDLDHFAAPEEDVGEAKPAPDDPAVAEEAADVFRPRAGGDVEILRLSAE